MMEHFNLVNKLHTDVLKEKYGKISAKVIKHDDKMREAHLVDEDGVSRTYALTFFTEEKKDPEIQKIDENIRSGSPIGEAFRLNGYEIRKNVIAVYVLKIPPWLRKDFRTKSKLAKARLSEFYAKKKDEKPIIYGTVVEIYSPDFREPKINKTDKAQVNPLAREFEKIKISKNEVWKRIGFENNWQDIKEKYLAAKRESGDDVKEFKNRIRNYIDKN
jgi:hypothetical protein